ncbi:MAG: hypothetical protein ACI3ZD_06135 [Prevotella sp.]
MFHIDNPDIRSLLFQGNFGLEKEGLRITHDGHMSHTPHPFGQHANITRDFCENQTEINTPVCKSAEKVVESLYGLTQHIRETLAEQEVPEYWWPFSNPPYIKNEKDIPIAQFVGKDEPKTAYRNYLSGRYGRYKMTFSGIHFNYSFAGDLLRKNYQVETGITIEKGQETAEYNTYVDRMYLDLAERLVEYGWVMVPLTAASPLLDNSFVEQGRSDSDVFSGMASMRCSEFGYWNAFSTVLDYSDIKAYTDSIQWYVDKGLIYAPSELYYPIRLKPRGENSLASLREHGINHIELRMIDINPLCKEGIDLRDVKFAWLLLLWLASMPERHLTDQQQVQATQNYKNSAWYNLHISHVVTTDDQSLPVAEATLKVLDEIEAFCRKIEAGTEMLDIVSYQRLKITDPHNYRYSHIVKRKYSGNYVKKGLELCASY